MATGNEIRDLIVNLAQAAIDAQDFVDDLRKDARDGLLGAALAAMGIDIDVDHIDKDSIGRALGDKIGEEAGVELGNIFDADAVRHALLRKGIKLAMDEAGISGQPTVQGLKDGLASMVRDKIKEAISTMDADVLGGVQVPEYMVALAKAAAQPVTANVPRKFDAKSVNNRERQARYREAHSRKWVPI